VTITGRRKGLVGLEQLEETTTWMTTLNDRASHLFVSHGVRTLTDVTGFGLIGHGLEMADASGVGFVLDGESIPLQSGAIDLARKEVRTSGDARNRRSSAGRVVFRASAAHHLDILLHDPQTSGGLLASVSPSVAEAILARASCEGIPMWDIGSVDDSRGITIA
jgi:selenide,water dikinase